MKSFDEEESAQILQNDPVLQTCSFATGLIHDPISPSLAVDCAWTSFNI